MEEGVLNECRTAIKRIWGHRVRGDGGIPGKDYALTVWLESPEKWEWSNTSYLIISLALPLPQLYDWANVFFHKKKRGG